MMVTTTMTQQAGNTQQRFVEHPTTYGLDSLGPDPELKKLLPLMFVSLDQEIDTDGVHQDDAEFFGKLFVDNTKGEVRKSVGSQKILPISKEDVKGISSRFTRGHPGIDYRANVGSNVRAILPGIVNEVSYERGGYGRYVIIVHHVDGKTLFSLYAHMRDTNVMTGDTIEAGDKIGEVGLTGHTTGPHLHFELHDSRLAIDPIKFFAGSSLAMVIK